jgi:N6-adenosine-specific RNA methylase IME4
MKKYNIIYADPPWNGLGWNNGSGQKCPANHYQVQDIEWIKSLQVQNISDNLCFLFLWVTFPNLQEGLDTIREWGFKYSTCAFNWVKRNKKSDGYFVGCGNYTRANSELCLLGTKGKCQSARQSRSVRQICDARIMGHSQKPPEIRDRIVSLCGDLPRIELFARQEIDGWDTWGNEVELNESITKALTGQAD